VDSRVVSDVLGELKGLVELERIEAAIATAKAGAPQAALAQIDGAVVTAPAPIRPVRGGWLPPINTINPDVTCVECWGFEASLSSLPGLEPW
jgi:hypothetical protein